MLSRVLIKQQRGRRPLAALAAFSLLASLVLASGTALAVWDESFQLDGNVVDDAAAAQPFDWANFFNASGVPTPTLPNASRPGFDASGFDRDFTTNQNGSFNTSDNTTFATGSKDTLPITPGWQCNVDNNVLSKSDVMNAYAASFVETEGTPAVEEEILYFALERNANTGTGNVGFWFLQDAVACESPGGSTAFSGDHTDGDLLVVSEFSQGGAVATIQVYRWDGGPNGTLNPNPVAAGASCATAVADSTVCAIVNTGTISTPWPTANKQDGPGTSLRVSEFFEAGLNLTQANLGGKCFNTFIADTRSSTSLTATIFDFSLGTLGQCTSTTTTSPRDATNTGNPPATSIPADPADAKVEVKDRTVIDVGGANTFAGSISWWICGPTAPASTQLCDGTAGNVGVALTPQNITTEGTYFSPTATVTAAGRYCFRAVFSGDVTVGVPGSSDSSSGECFTVAPVQPTLTTDATDGPVDFGQPISDSVTLSGTAHKPGTGGPTGSNGTINPTTLGGDATGAITVKAFGPDSCSTVAFESGSIAASGDGTYTGAAFQFTPTAPGQYIFVASYAGDSPNTLGIAESGCAAAPDAEKVTVRTIPTNVISKQDWIPNDTATVSASAGNLVAGGSVVFQLWSNATCDGTLLYTQTVAVPGGSPTAEVSTSNTGTGAGMFRITSAYADAANSVKGAYSWKVTYTPAAGDTAHTGSSSACDEEHFSVTYTNDND